MKSLRIERRDLQFDNYPKHKSSKAKNFENFNIKIIDWYLYFPYLLPIGNV